jgi:hypothetical protein
MNNHKQKHHLLFKDRINIADTDEVRLWLELFKVSREVLKNAVKEVGPNARRVQEYLQGR